ncbi:MAG: hypothetical protein EKK42_17790 [Pseudonocardiaceae bacterium]|nr:MAG: hypothetical protein EKK42_17790 [Pseudonocardiaceae bacterium]
MLLTVGDGATGRRLPFHGSRPGSGLARVPAALASVPAVALPSRPGRGDVDPVLDEQRPGRLIVSGDDADLAAVLVRLLRKDLLGTVEVAFVPTSRRSPAAAAWGLPRDRAQAAALALDGQASPVPLIRDDAGGVLVGRGEVRNLRGEAYCDNTLVVRGTVRRLVATPGPDGVSSERGRGVTPATGRALQIGCVGATVVVNGVEHPRVVPRWVWYRHTTDWLLVRPSKP